MKEELRFVLVLKI